MPDVLLELPIAATPEQVCSAITEQTGLSSWWTPDVVVKPKPGSVGEFRFRGGQFVVKMEITALEHCRMVRWAVRQGAPEWAGTSVTWDLAPADHRTNVRFAHRGFASVDGSFASVAFNWAWYLSSLKDYLEAGQGRPGQLHA
jgi:uncharacterized protein YndB with AHSA1/START domain